MQSKVRSKVPIASGQCFAARELASWNRQQLASQSGLSMQTIIEFEAGQAIAERDLDAIERAFRAHGIYFTYRSVSIGPRPWAL